MWTNPHLFISNSIDTFYEMGGGFSLALIFAFPLAWMMYLCKSCRAFMQPLFVIIQCIPMFTLAPLMIMWFGWSYMAVVLPTALMIFLPLTLNIYQGLSSTPQGLLNYFKINQATPWQTFFKLQLPWALPYIFAGFRISAAVAGIGAIAGEWAGAQSGLGVLMLKSRRSTDLETSFGALFCLMFMSIGLYTFIAYAEYRYRQYKSLKFFPVILFGIICIAALSTLPRQQSIKQPTRLLLDWLPNSNHVPLYAGIEKEIFAKNGIHLQIMELNDPSDTLPYISSGKVDIALFYMPDVVKAQLQGISLTLAGVLIDQPLNSFIFRNDQEITVPTDLSGKSIGICLAGSNPSLLQRLLNNFQIVPKELKHTNFDLVTLLGMRQVDVIYGAFWNIEKEHLKSLGIQTSHIDVAQVGHPFYSELVFVGKGDPKKFENFKKAMQKSIDYCKAHPEEAFELYVKCHPEKSPRTIAWEYQAWKNTLPLLAKSQTISEEEWQGLEDWLSND